MYVCGRCVAIGAMILLFRGPVQVLVMFVLWHHFPNKPVFREKIYGFSFQGFFSLIVHVRNVRYSPYTMAQLSME